MNSNKCVLVEIYLMQRSTAKCLQENINGFSVFTVYVIQKNIIDLLVISSLLHQKLNNVNSFGIS